MYSGIIMLLVGIKFFVSIGCNNFIVVMNLIQNYINCIIISVYVKMKMKVKIGKS